MDEDSAFIKLLVVGDPGVGKTSLLNRFCYEKYDEHTKPTIGCDFQTKVFQNYKGKTLRVQLWDIAGQEKFHSVTKLYVRGAAGAVIVCDVLNEGTLKSTIKWKEIIEEFCDIKDGKPIPSILVQNKTDLLKTLDKREEFTKLEYLNEWGKKNNFFAVSQTSAKEDPNITVIFDKIIDEILGRNLIITRPGNYKERLSKEKLEEVNSLNRGKNCC